MRRTLTGAAIAATALSVAAVAVGQIDSGVPSPQPRSGVQPNIFAPGYTATVVARGSDPLENGTGQYQRYGYVTDGGAGSDAPTSGLDTKSEPDQNTYIVASGVGGPTPGYDYGTHFLFQGHEIFGGSSSGPSGGNIDKAYLTRINLDVTDPAHRITLINQPQAPSGGVQSTGIRSIDGSTYDPFSKELLFTAEAGNKGGVVGTPLKWSGTSIPPLANYYGSMGQGGYEGIHNDDRGNVMIVEDVGGSGVTDGATATKVKQPNSFIYRFKPTTPGDLTAGRLQALQVSVDGTPITFHTGAGARDDALGEPIRRLHSGERLDARWVTIHDTATDGTTAFAANPLAKSGGATPFKRPENGKFVPDSDFRSFVFDETGDTDKTASEYPGAADRGSWGALLRLDMPAAGADTGTVKTIINGDKDHASFDNVAFLDKDTVLLAEDRGDTLHKQLGFLDSLWSYDTRLPIDAINGDAKRVEAQGRDAEAYADVQKKEASPPVPDQNDGDNEVTGIHVSDGSTAIGGILGTHDPATLPGIRAFVSQQHGENIAYEIARPAPKPGPKDGQDGAQGTQGNQGPQGKPGTVTRRGTFSVALGKSTRRTIPVRVTVPSPGAISGALTAKVRGRTLHVGSFKRTLTKRGRSTITLRPKTSTMRGLHRARRASGVLTATFRPTSGSTRRVNRKVTVRG